MGTQLKLHSLVRVRVSRPLEVQLLQWATRAGLSYSDFVRMALVLGAREFVVRANLWRPGDDPEVRDIEDFRWHGEALPEKLDGHSGGMLNPTGRLPTDEELAASWASREARLVRK